MLLGYVLKYLSHCRRQAENTSNIEPTQIGFPQHQTKVKLLYTEDKECI